MIIKWANIVALILALTALIVIFKTPHEIGAFLGTMRYIGSGNPDDEMLGLLAFGLVLVLVVAVAKIAIDGNRKD